MGDLALTPNQEFEAAMTRLDGLTVKPSKVLRAAAELLEKGWCQGSLGLTVSETARQASRLTEIFPLVARHFQPGAEIDQVCLSGAILKAVVDLTGVGWPKANEVGTSAEIAMKTSFNQADRAVAEYLVSVGQGIPEGLPVLANWNDCSGRTQVEVVALVHAAAAAEEEAGR